MEGFVVESDILDLGTMLNHECAMQATSANAKHIHLQNTVPVGTMALGDKSMVELVVRNLISNAIKFTGSGGRILAQWKRQDDHMHIGICDDGVGIPPQLVEKILGPDFFSTIGTAHEKGSGLGLRLCRDFLKQNGGDLWLTHNEDRGTTFWFSLLAN
jgi:signal transduction histidine kinase